MVSKILKFSSKVLIGLVIGSPIILGQVIIRESIPIDPRPPVQLLAGNAAGATLRFEFRYDGPTREPDLNGIRVRNIVCGVDQSGPLNSSISVPAQSGIWSFFARIHTPVVAGSYAVTSVYLNSDLIQKDSALISCASTCQINLSSGVILSNTFNFSANGYVLYGEQASLGAQASGQVHCTNEIWHPGLPVELSIVSGADRGQFANARGDTLGDAVTVPGREVGTITFIADGIEPDSISDYVTIQASSSGITRTATIEVLRVSPSPIWLGLRAQGDVSYGAEMYLEAQALDMFQSEVGAGSGVTYTFEIIEGSQWGSLFRLAAEGNKIENVIPTNGFFSRGYALVGFRARKQEPDGAKRVTVEVRASDPAVHPAAYSFHVLPSPLAISVIPPEVGYGEQSTILVQKKDAVGSGSPWPADAGLYFEIIKGMGAGYVFYDDTASRNDWFDGQSSTVQFAALEESPQPDTVEVQFYVQVYDEGTTPPVVIAGASGPLPRPDMSILSSNSAAAWGPVPQNPALTRTGLVTLKVIKRKDFEILLGQSKYYYAVIEGENLVLKDDGDPILPSPQKLTNVSFSLLETNGVYWDRWRPVFSNDQFHMVGLPDGMVRLIGRFWEAKSPDDYKAVLRVSSGTSATTVTVRVKRPRALGTSPFATSRAVSRDVFDGPVNVDSLCIAIGGKLGIPPQFIKAQMQEETPYVSGLGFAPAYRYEPYTTQFRLDFTSYIDNPFYVRSGDIGTPPPPDHEHVQYIPYFKNPVTVWDVLVMYSDLGDNPAIRLYGSLQPDGTMKFIKPSNIIYSKIQDVYNSHLAYFLDPLGGGLGLPTPLTRQQAADSARRTLIEYLRDRWHKVGAKNIMAQTRIGASYGLLQLLYVTALEEESYPDSSLPEKINVTQTGLDLAMKRQKRLLTDGLRGIGIVEDSEDWSIGYENAFYAVLYPAWNPKSNYWLNIINHSTNYLPVD